MPHWVYLFFCGLCMGAADIVPGVSGGTIAFILGIYDEFLDSIKSFNSQTLALFLQLKYKKFFNEVNWKFLVCLTSGMILSLLALAKGIQYLLNHEIYRSLLYAVFFGLISASIVFCIKQLESFKGKECLATLAGIIFAFCLTEPGMTLLGQKKTPYNVRIDNLCPYPHTIENLDLNTMTLNGITADQLAAMLSKQCIKPTTHVFDSTTGIWKEAKEIEYYHAQSSVDFWLIICGIIAVSAMLLPGISGSYLLHILGVYGLVIGSLADLGEGLKHFTMEKEAVWVLTNLLLGILIGAVVSSRFISICLRNFRQLTLATLIGFMIGSMRSIWPFWSYTYVLNPLKLEKGPLLQQAFPILPNVEEYHFWLALAFAGISFTCVYVMEVWSNRAVRSS